MLLRSARNHIFSSLSAIPSSFHNMRQHNGWMVSLVSRLDLEDAYPSFSPDPQSLAHFFDPSGIPGNGISPTFLWSQLHSLVRHQVAEAHHDFFSEHTAHMVIYLADILLCNSDFSFRSQGFWVLRSTSQIHPGAFPMCPVFFWGLRWSPCSFPSLGDLGRLSHPDAQGIGH